MGDAEKSGKESGKSESGSGLTSILNLIPSIYYDLIARILPGMAFWIALALKYPGLLGVEQEAVLGTISSSLLMVLVILGYVCGIVFTGFAVLWDWLSIATLTCIRPIAVLLEQAGTASSSAAAKWKTVSKQLDQVIQADEGAGKTLVKAMAEVSLCQNLLTGFIVLALVEISFPACNALSVSQHPGFYSLTALALLLAMYARQTMFLGRVSHLYEIHVIQPRDAPATPHASTVT